MSLLAQRFRQVASKHKDHRMKNEAESDVGYSTGFLNFDFRNGAKINVETKNGMLSYYSIGIVDGTMITLIGRSGCGKTTFALQAASNIVRPFLTSTVFYDSIEAGATETRQQLLTNFHGDELKARFITRNTGVTAENFYERIKMIHDLKNDNRADFEYDTGLLNSQGNKIIKLEPTCYILDSLALLMPEKYTDEDELSGQMSATAAAKANSSIFKRIIPMLKNANIILFAINHINQAVAINQFDQKKAQVSYLKQGETLPGGNASIYLSNNVIRFDDRQKIIAEKDTVYKLDGALVDLTLIKSRTNKAGQTTTLVFDQNKGFDQEWSLFTFLKDSGRINGAGSYFYIGDRDDMKFAQKNFIEKIQTDKEFYDVFINETMIALKALVPDVKLEAETKSNQTIMNDILTNLNSN